MANRAPARALSPVRRRRSAPDQDRGTATGFSRFAGSPDGSRPLSARISVGEAAAFGFRPHRLADARHDSWRSTAGRPANQASTLSPARPDGHPAAWAAGQSCRTALRPPFRFAPSAWRDTHRATQYISCFSARKYIPLRPVRRVPDQRERGRCRLPPKKHRCRHRSCTSCFILSVLNGMEWLTVAFAPHCSQRGVINVSARHILRKKRLHPHAPCAADRVCYTPV